MTPMRRMPGGVVPRRAADRPVPRGARRLSEGGELAPGAPFDPATRPLGMIAQTWIPTDEPEILERPKPAGDGVRQERPGPSLTVWIILAVVALVVVLAVISYRNAPP